MREAVTANKSLRDMPTFAENAYYRALKHRGYAARLLANYHFILRLTALAVKAYCDNL